MLFYLHYYIGRDNLSYNNQQRFTTKDRDQDNDPYRNCAVDRQGAWWYKACSNSNLNGNYNIRGDSAKGLQWYGYPSSYTMKMTKIMVKCDKS